VRGTRTHSNRVCIVTVARSVRTHPVHRDRRSQRSIALARRNVAVTPEREHEL
jgi:hypothetical protein